MCGPTRVFGTIWRVQAAITKGIADVPFNVQWIGRAPWLFSLRNLGFWGYGWGLLISGALGIVLILLRARKRDWRNTRRKRADFAGQRAVLFDIIWRSGRDFFQVHALLSCR